LCDQLKLILFINFKDTWT